MIAARVAVRCLRVRTNKMCEGCGTKQAGFGTLTERKKRWCCKCGKAHNAVNLTVQKLCEACGTRQAHFGTLTEGKKRWCGACGQAHGAVNLKTQRVCENCGTKTASSGTLAERERWALVWRVLGKATTRSISKGRLRRRSKRLMTTAVPVQMMGSLLASI